MKHFKKANWTSDENTIHVGMEFSKVNKQKRLVHGWATLDNIDTEGDIVTASASVDAFNRARGNLREMHKKDSAVGRVVSFKEDTFTAPNGEVHKGIFVTARVSEGAQDTWLKVLDGTLSGFSIGGAIVEAEEDWSKDGSQKIRKVTKYDLTELSLVDNPGNQYANVFRIQKAADGSVTNISGMVEDQKIFNVFYCDEDEICKETPDDSYECPVCLENMTIIGYVEDGGDRNKKVSNLVTKYLNPHLSNEGGENMPKLQFTSLIKSARVDEGDEKETVATGHEAGDPTEVPTPTEPAQDVEEVQEEPTAQDVDEVDDESDEIVKQIDGLKKSIKDILENNNIETSKKIEALEKTIKETRESFEKKISEVDTKLSGLDKDLGVAKSRQESLEASLNKINSSVALRKSADLDESVEPVQNEDPWNGSAFSLRGIMNSRS